MNLAVALTAAWFATGAVGLLAISWYSRALHRAWAEQDRLRRKLGDKVFIEATARALADKIVAPDPWCPRGTIYALNRDAWERAGRPGKPWGDA